MINDEYTNLRMLLELERFNLHDLNVTKFHFLEKQQSDKVGLSKLYSLKNVYEIRFDFPFCFKWKMLAWQIWLKTL